MLFEVASSGTKLKSMQLSSHPACALFEQEIRQSSTGEANIVVRYHGSDQGGIRAPLCVPLNPSISCLEKISVDLHGSATVAYRMGGQFDAWFSTHFGITTILVYIGDGRRPVLGQSLIPETYHSTTAQPGIWFSLISYITASSINLQPPSETPWLTFTDVAPLLVTSEASLRYVNERMMKEGAVVEMFKFRPNIVVDGEGEGPWAEDFWAELSFTDTDAASSKEPDHHKLLLTGNCARCTSLDVDYKTGKPAVGELGNVLKRLMKERRVDPGTKWSPVFGRYAFLPKPDGGEFTVSVGDSVVVTRYNAQRSVWDWPGL